MAIDGSDVHDAAGGLFDHGGDGGAAAEDGGAEVAIEDGVDIFHGDVNGVVVLGLAPGGGNVPAGVVDEDVESAEAIVDLFDSVVDGGGVVEVGEDGEDGDAELFKFGGDVGGGGRFIELGGGAVGSGVEDDGRAASGEAFDHGAAESAGGGGDPGDLSGEHLGIDGFHGVHRNARGGKSQIEWRCGRNGVGLVDWSRGARCRLTAVQSCHVAVSRSRA